MRLDAIKAEIRNVVQKGFFHIFVGSLFSKLIRFAASLVVVQILDKSTYGLWSYVLNIYHIILLFDGLGIVAGVLQYCSRAENDISRFEYFKFGLRFGLSINLIISGLTFLVFLFAPLPLPEARIYLLFLAFIPIIRIMYSLIEVYMRSLLLNKKYSLLVISNAVVYVLVVILATFHWGIAGLILCEYAVFFIGIITALLLLRKQWPLFLLMFKRISDWLPKREVIVYSVVASISTLISSLLYMLDQFLIGVLISDEKVIASYNVSTQIPYNLNFIPMSVMIFIYPYFARNADNLLWLRFNYRKLTFYMGIFSASLSALLIVFAEPVVRLLFGEKYLDSVEIIRILMLGFFIVSTFRIPQGNILAATGNIKANFYISVVSGVLNCIIAYVFIVNWGPVGAAFATLIVFIASSIISFFVLKKVLKGQKYIW